MASRLELHEKLCDILGSRYVYFQPPESVKLNFPCIIYHRQNKRMTYADNDIYTAITQYVVTVVDKDPDSEIPDRLMRSMQYCSMERHFCADGLNHDVFIIFF